MSDILAEIVARLQPELAARKQACPPAQLARAAEALPDPLRFTAAFAPGGGVRVIAEIKKASPSKGLIRADFRPLELALELEAAGAAALSVLTEPNYFLGSLDYLRTIAAQVKIPVLRKEFIFDEYQIFEARAAGAAAVLLIAALLDDRELAALTRTAHRLKLEVLGEAHNAAELKRLLDSEVDLIGVNARNLHSFATDLAASAELLAQIPPERLPIAESAIRNCADIESLRRAGSAGFLIGETLMRAASPGVELRRLRGECR